MQNWDKKKVIFSKSDMKATSALRSTPAANPTFGCDA